MSDQEADKNELSATERELADYLNELISAAVAKRSPGTRDERSPEEETADIDTGKPEPEGREIPASTRRRVTIRASMREGLAPLFSNTQALRFPHSPAAPLQMPHPDAVGPSAFLTQYLRDSDTTREPAPCGLAELDARLAGGFGSGLNLVAGAPGVGKTAFIESVAWETVGTRCPVLYYALREGSLGTWERLVSTLSYVMGGPFLRLPALRARTLDEECLATLEDVDRALQASVLPWLSLLETIPAYTDPLTAFLEDVSLRVMKARDQQGRTPLVLVDDLQRLLLHTRARGLLNVLSRIDDALAAGSIPGLLTLTPADFSGHVLAGLPAQGIVTLEPAHVSPDDSPSILNLGVLANTRTGWTGTIPLILDRRSGLIAAAGAR
jgi:hypothetical protein